MAPNTDHNRARATAPSNEGTMRVAVIGSGMAGLSAAWMLSQNRNVEVHIFEKFGTLGLGAHSVPVPVDPHAGTEVVVDIPARVFVTSYYTELISLYETVGVRFHTADASTAYQMLGASAPHFRYSNLLVGQYTIPYVFGWEALSLSYVRMVRDLFRFRRLAQDAFRKGELANVTLGDFLKRHGFGLDFVQKFLVPMLTIICTCSFESILNYPAEDIVEFMLCLTLRGEGCRRATGGTTEIVALLSKHATSKRCNAVIDKVWSEVVDGDRTSVCVKTAEGVVERFDHVVIATQANHAFSILRDPLPEHVASIGAIRHESSAVVLHRDPRLMPARRKDWSPCNVFVNVARGEGSCTAWQNRIQTENDVGAADLFQTWNPLIEPEDKLTIAKSYFDRPIVTLETRERLRRLASVQGHNNIWFCGAYSLPGIPLLENAVRSGLAVAEAIAPAKRPWKAGTRQHDGLLEASGSVVSRAAPYVLIGACAAWYLTVRLR
eukprot:Opistho-1_new@44210